MRNWTSNDKLQESEQQARFLSQNQDAMVLPVTIHVLYDESTIKNKR
jgi:hypothetical protein